ncbi:MAG: hypothetical protein ACFFB3_12965 [Candidatus Hodarchaeota archaeon]
MNSHHETYYESYPHRIMSLSLGQMILSNLIGILIFYLIIDWLGLVYFFLCLIMLFVAMKFRCSYCYYYDKRCPSGLGKLCKFFFKQGASEEFQNPRNIAPTATLSVAVLLLPFGGGLVLLFEEFSWFVLMLLILYLLIAGLSGYFLRKDLLCKNCKQGQIGCPAYRGMIEGKTITNNSGKT